MKVAILVLALIALVQADMYLHNPRGSNNRLDEAKRDRNNANRVFDSQNNNRGGYNVGSLYYYAGSVLPIEWTNQHSCADQNNHCEIIFQYMCDENVRDGASTNTIPQNPVLCEDYDCNTDLEYGMHESFDYYLTCRLRSRNMGLFYADQNLNGQNARYTRQNPNGNRRGYECPEERDYYPYWHPTPWRDIAILTNDATRCPYYQSESANVKSRYECILPGEYISMFATSNNKNYIIPNNQDECEMWSWLNPRTGNLTHADWVEFIPDPRLSAPECVESLWSRDNHLGNSMGGFPNYFNWTIPDIPHERCVFRARYNITSGEYGGFNSSINSSINTMNTKIFNAQTNTVSLNKKISTLDVYSKFGFNFESAKERGYVYRNNPVVKVFPDPPVGVNGTSKNFGLQLAINTNQFGRTFQDRSHTFAIREKTSGMDCYDSGTIYNLNVRGKRGNIVQTYPGVEYDFVPNRLTVAEGDCIHIQWTGSNTNPNNNAGQGKAGTDRSNIVLLRDTTYNEVAVDPNEMKMGHFARSYPTHLDEKNGTYTFLGWDRESRQSLAMLTPNQYGGEMSELDDAGTYFDLGPKKVTQRGTYHYMCSRNNNFTNRSQKGKIVVQGNSLTNKRIGWNGGELHHSKATVKFEQGDLMKPETFRLEKFADEGEALQAIKDMTGTSAEASPGEARSDYYYISSDSGEQLTSETQQEIEINIKLESGIGSDPKIYVANSNTQGSFKELDTRVSDGTATAYSAEGGVFVASASVVTQYVVIATVSFLLIVFVIAIVATGIYFRVRRDKWEKVKGKVSGGMNNIKRSFAKEV